VSDKTRWVGLFAIRASRVCVCVSILAAISAPAWSQQKSGDLTSASLEDLINMEVVSVTKTEQKLSRTASAVFVITQEDIRRSGALNIPDLLRMVPGIDVAQIDANTWAISVRGLNGRFANELLVLVDGRSVYTSSFGGVYWDTLDIPLEDIERIEVIRGPGGSVWGANAVNGVINIITKKASETQGARIDGGGGNVQQGFGTVQYGGTLGDSTQYRAYTKYFNDDHFPDPFGLDGGDGWRTLRGGFRTDTTLTPNDTLMVQGDLYSTREGTPTLTLPSITSPTLVPTELLVNISGGFIQSVWDHTYSPKSNTFLEISYDQYERHDTLGDRRVTLDVNFQHHFNGWSRQSILWSFEYRRSNSNSHGTLFSQLVPTSLATNLYSASVQDEITLLPNQLILTVGTRIEHNYYTGFNVMPSGRAAWTPSERQTLWAAVSDAVRSPSAKDAGVRSDRGSFLEPDGTLAVLAFLGNPHIGDESLIAYELGYRREIANRLSVDFAAYYNAYHHLETVEPTAPFFESTPAPPHLVIPETYENLMGGETHGIEAAANWKVTHRWTLSPGYAFEKIHLRVAPTSQDTTSAAVDEGSTPDHSAQLRSHLELSHGFAWDSSAYFVDRLAALGVPSYTRLDTRLSWKLGERTSLSVVGQNLLHDHHAEFVDDTGSASTTLVKRSVYAQLSWQF